MAKSARQNVMEKLKKFGGFVEARSADKIFVIEAIAPDNHFWIGNGAHAIIASVPKGSYTMDAWQKIHTIIKSGTRHCDHHYKTCNECEYQPEKGK